MPRDNFYKCLLLVYMSTTIVVYLSVFLLSTTQNANYSSIEALIKCHAREQLF